MTTPDRAGRDDRADDADPSVRDATVAELRTAVAERTAARAARKPAPGTDSFAHRRRLTTAQLRARRAIVAAHQDGGLTVRELAVEVGVGTDAIRAILRSVY